MRIILFRVARINIMGRTVPTWRDRIESEIGTLSRFNRALNHGDRIALEILIEGVRNRRAAGGMMPSVDPWKPMLVSMLLECYSKIAELERTLEDLSSER